MDRETARQTLPIAEFERWEKLHDLIDNAEATRERWDDEDAEVAELTVHADMDALGTDLDLYGNDVTVHVSEANQEATAHLRTLQREFSDVAPEEVPDLSDGDRERIADALVDAYDAVLVRWNGNAWADLDESLRASVLADARAKWGIDGLLMGWIDIADAVHSDREDKLDVVESFRDPERRGDR